MEELVTDGAFTPEAAVILEAILTPRSAWTKRHEDAAIAYAPELRHSARSILGRFSMPRDGDFVSDAVQQWWELVLRDQGFSRKPQYGLSKYTRLFMMRAVGRIANRRGRRRARPMKTLENVSTTPLPPVENVSRQPDRPGFRRIRPLSEADNVVAKGPTPLDQVEQLQTAEEIAAEIRRLKTTLREPLRCIFYDGLSITETAAKLGVSPNCVRLRLHRAKQALRPRLRRFRK